MIALKNSSAVMMAKSDHRPSRAEITAAASII
jgi:hypothetical protein